MRMREMREKRKFEKCYKEKERREGQTDRQPDKVRQKEQI